MNKILLVEDDAEISAMLKHFLATENFEVVTASDGESACSKFFSDTFSLVLLDLMIPKMSGMEVMERIREHHTVPIIILSAKDTDSDPWTGAGGGRLHYETIFRYRGAGPDQGEYPKEYAVCPFRRGRTARSDIEKRQPCDESGPISGYKAGQQNRTDLKGI